MSFTVGLSNTSLINLGGKAAASSAASDAAVVASDQVTEDKKAVAGLGAHANVASDEGSDSEQSVAVQTLLKRMQQLQQQLRDQQQQLAAIQAASYPSAEAKAAAVTPVQQLVAATSGAISQVAAALVKALTEGATAGNLVRTRA